MESNSSRQLISNPTNNERRNMIMNSLISKNRLYDFQSIVKLLSPPPDITNFGVPGQFKGLKVGIIGGGLAGLSAAFELRKLGFDVTIFEAKGDRIGGRVYTYYFNNDKNLYGEFGAMRIPASHETVWHYINLFKLNTIPFVQNNQNALVYIREAYARSTPESIMQNIYPKFELTEKEKNTPWPKLYNQVPQTVLNSIPLDIRPELLQILPKYSPPYERIMDANERQIMESFGLSFAAISLIVNMLPMIAAVLYNGYGETLIEEYSLNFMNMYQIVGGTINLPLAFYNSLNSQYPKEYNNIPMTALGKFTWKPNHWVTGIYKSDVNEKVILRYMNNQQHISADESFDYVICANPLSELRKMDIHPLFRNRKLQAMREAYYLNAQKTLFLCKERFWERNDSSQRILGGVSNTDLLIESILYPSYDIHDEHSNNINRPGVIIASYNLDLDAERLGTMEEEERFILIKRQVEKVHGLPTGYLDKIVTDHKTVDWNKEIRFNGAFARFFAEQRREFFYELSIPEYDNRVFFAGEHVSQSHAWMQGALISGMQVANKIAYQQRMLQGR